MSFSDHKITQFTHKITDLPDQPSLPANELKARFDSSPEELRQAVNGICDEASRLEARVEGIVVDTFGDTIDREMLSEELAAELDAKATQAGLAAEQQAREALSGRVSALENAVPQKSEMYFGTYTGTGSYPRTLSIGFTPKAVIIGHKDGLIADETAVYSTLMLQGYKTDYCGIVSNGFTLYEYKYSKLNYNGAQFYYIAFR
ncbi:hypothetical protein RX717_00220 [Intestinibacillus sp. NTUH-41-i26]|uniref:hypothetical protein n=1 Tax=Intestinibacillus sp. NTUH-41-i26 TaxID=3079303 RepID=UPI0029347E38|nr:hypothetical protein [Intestinibacillus sp. NTUH-41-i26]WOC75458.1 hypothetical protein RX717_00220 [Intestinibacillus sp. NTUH-41-i26]